MKHLQHQAQLFQQKIILEFLVIGLFLALPAFTFAAPGDLDPTFGTGGKVITPLLNADFRANFARKMAIQPDGKIIVSGQGYSNSTGSRDYLVRYNPNGSLDTAFGTGGAVIIPSQYPGNFENFTNGLAILPDGKILVSGYSINFPNDRTGFTVFRFNSNGSRDTSFGANGAAVTSFGNANLDVGRTLKVQPDGKIVVFGDVYSNCDFYDCFSLGSGVARFNSDGTIDTSFGTDGKLVIKNPDGKEYSVVDSTVLPNGKLLLLGGIYDYSKQKIKTFLSRINANGTLDTSFGTNGILLPEIGQPDYYPYQSAVQPDGKIVFSVTEGTDKPDGSVSGSSMIVRLNQDGTFDASFGTNGKVVIPTSEGVFVHSIEIQSNGKILAAGRTSGVTPSRFAIVRLNTDGSRDTTFGSNGIVATLLDSNVNDISDIALQPDGKLVAVGRLYYAIGLARYVLDSSRPTLFDFDGDGKADISVFRPSNGTWYLNQSTQGFSAIQFGLSTDKITPADYDGDGKTDIAVYRNGTWYLQRSRDGFLGVGFGLPTDIPVPADFDGDGKSELAVFRPSNGVWYSLNLVNNGFNAVQFGSAEDDPEVADYDGDGKADQAVYRPSNGTWYMLKSRDGFDAVQFGKSTDIPDAGDYDGDGRADQAVYRQENGTWYIFGSKQGFSAIRFGSVSDLPVAADYDGDGKTDVAVFRGGTWYLLGSQQGFGTVQFGNSDDKPVANACESCGAWDY